mgnify:FL=1
MNLDSIMPTDLSCTDACALWSTVAGLAGCAVTWAYHYVHTQRVNDQLRRANDRIRVGAENYEELEEHMSAAQRSEAQVKSQLQEARAEVGEAEIRRRREEAAAAAEAMASLRQENQELREQADARGDEARRALAEARDQAREAQVAKAEAAEALESRRAMLVRLHRAQAQDRRHARIEREETEPGMRAEKIDEDSVKNVLLRVLGQSESSNPERAKPLRQKEFAARVGYPFTGEFHANQWLNKTTANAHAHFLRSEAVISWLKTLDLAALGLHWDRWDSGKITPIRPASARPAHRPRRLRLSPPTATVVSH